MLARKKATTIQLSSQSYLTLKYLDFNKFSLEDMIRMTKVPTTPTPSTFKPFLSHTSRNKTKPVSHPNMLTYLMNQIVIPLNQHSLIKMSMILPHLQLQFLLPISLQPREHLQEFTSHFLRTQKKLIIQKHKDVKVTPSTQHCTIANHQPIPHSKPLQSLEIFFFS